MLHEAAPEWLGAPLHFTAAYYSPVELDAAFEHWQFLYVHDKTVSALMRWRFRDCSTSPTSATSLASRA